MYYELILKSDEMPKPNWIDEMGGYNQLPRPFAEVEEKEFWDEYRTYSPKQIEYRQVHIEESHAPVGFTCHFCSANIFWFTGKAYALVFFPKEDKPRVYRLGCDHQYEGLSHEQCRKEGIYHGGRCFHVSRCTKCGHVHSIDSSD